MAYSYPIVLPWFLQFLFSWQFLGLKPLCKCKDYQSLALTPHSLQHITSDWKGGFADPLVARLQTDLATDDVCQLICLKYLVGSVATFGEVDPGALATLYELGQVNGVAWLPVLAGELSRENNCGTVLRQITEAAKYQVSLGSLIALLRKLMEKDWHVVKALVVKALAISDNAEIRENTYSLMKTFISMEQCYEVLATETVSLNTIRDLYPTEGPSPPLRALFMLARCSHRPSQRIRDHIATRVPYFKQFLSSDAHGITVLPYSGGVPRLNSDAFRNIFIFLDAETLLAAVPLVCRLWRSLCSTALAQNIRVHDAYLHDLIQFGLSEINKIVPWKLHLRSETEALVFLRPLIMDGSVEKFRAQSEVKLNGVIVRCFRAVASGRLPLLMLGYETSPCESFSDFCDVVYNLCDYGTPNLGKPPSLTDGEYARVVRHCVFERKWILTLSEHWIANNLPELFSIVENNEALMEKMLAKNFRNSCIPSIFLVMHGQAHGVSDKLAKFIFSRGGLFRHLIEPVFISPKEYYNEVVELAILPQLFMNIRVYVYGLWLLISVMVSFRDDPIKTDRLMQLMVHHLVDHSDPTNGQSLMRTMLLFLERKNVCPPEDITFAKEVMMRYGLLSSESQEVK